jgi:hypothetical protein
MPTKRRSDGRWSQYFFEPSGISPTLVNPAFHRIRRLGFSSRSKRSSAHPDRRPKWRIIFRQRWYLSIMIELHCERGASLRH